MKLKSLQPYIKTYLKTVVIKIMWYLCKGIHKGTKKTEKKVVRNRAIINNSLFYDKNDMSCSR